MLGQLLGLGCTPVEGGDAELKTVERDRCAPEDFYSTTNHRTLVRRGGDWHVVQNQRMDALIVWEQGKAYARRLRDLRAGDEIVAGHARHPRHPRIEGARSPCLRLHGERHLQRATGGDRRPADGPDAALAKASGSKVVVVAGPVVVHTGGAKPLASLIRNGYIRPC